MNGREKRPTGLRATAICLLMVAAGLAGGTTRAQPPVSRPGQHGESHAHDVLNFSELAAWESQDSAAAPRSRAARAHLKVKRSLPAVSPAGLPSGENSQTKLATPMAAELWFDAASVPPSPAASASFLALLDDATTFNPDTQGAVGPDHLMVTMASQVRIQDRLGGALSTVSLNGFWGTVGNSNVFDPRVLYDPFGQRWITTAISNPGTNNSSLLIAVSQTSDPTGNWFRRAVRVDLISRITADSPNVGLTKDWITVQANMFDKTNYAYFSSDIWVFNKANLYAGGAGQFTFFRYRDAGVTEANAPVPAFNYDDTYPTNFLVANWNGNADGFGYLRLFSVSGPVGAEVFTDYGTNGLFVNGAPTGNPPWETFSPTGDNFAPQLGTTDKIFIGDARMQDVVYRNGTLWCAQHIFLPADTPTRCAVQWWEITPGGTVLQRGRVDDASGSRFYAYPSLAVNRDEDVLLGYSRFASNQFPSANYAFHHFEDGPGSLRGDTVLKAGEARFAASDAGFVHWGDWSATVVDPVNETDLWTIQEYAAPPVSGTDRWGTWWGRVSPPSSLSVFAADAPDPVSAGSDVTYSIRVTNNFDQFATGARLVSTLPAGALFISATSSQGSCGQSNGVVTCNFGDILPSELVSATIVARLNQSGMATNTVTASAYGPEDSPADNTVKVLTTVAQSADLMLLARATPDPVTVGNPVTYAILVTNRGPSAATSVSLTNTLPFGVSYLSATASQGTCAQSGGIVTCTLGVLAGGGAVNVTIVATATTSGQLTDRANVATTAFDPNSSNNSTSVVSRATAAPTMQVISDRTITEDSVLGPITFTVSDLETPATNLVVTAFSSNQAIVPDGNIVLGVVSGTGGSSRTLLVTPAPDANGSVTITRVVTDSDGVAATNSFVLNIFAVNDPPTISTIPDQVTREDVVLGPINFTVGDVETPAANLTIFGASSNPTLIPNANIQFAGSGTNRTVTLSPATNQFGTATITVTVSDGVATSNNVFLVSVNSVNDPPTISDIANRVIDEDTSTGAIPFTVGDVETAAGLLTPLGSSSNPTLVPNASIVFGGSGINRTVVVTPATNQFGSATITITVLDLDGGSTNDTFLLTVNPVNDPPTLDPIADQTISENATQQTVLLSGISAGAPNEVQTLTVKAVSSRPSLIPDPLVNYTSANTNGSLTFTPVPNSNGTATITVSISDGAATNSRSFSVTVQPMNHPPTISAMPDLAADEDTTAVVPFTVNDLETPANLLRLEATSSNPELLDESGISFGGSGTNRTILLTPLPDQSGSATIITLRVTDGSGAMASTNFQLTVRPVNDLPTISGLTNLTIAKDAVPPVIGFSVNDPETLPSDLIVSASSSNQSLLPNANVLLGGTGTSRTLTLRPVINQLGSAIVSVVVRDGPGLNAGAATNSFVLTVQNALPFISRLANTNVNEDAALLVPFTIGSAQSPATQLTLTAASSNPSLLPLSAISFGGSASNRTVTLVPAANQNGTVTVTITVSDPTGLSSSSAFFLTVNPVNDPPTISDIPNQQTNEDTPLSVPFTIGDLETAALSLTLSGTSSNPGLVANTNILFNGAGASRAVSLVPSLNATGTTLITLTVSDGAASAGDSFLLTVLPINDPPTLDPISDLNVVATGGNPSYTANLTGISSGAANETQPLTVTATAGNLTLLSTVTVNYAGGSSGSLTLRAVNNAQGSTVVTVTVSDGQASTVRRFNFNARSSANVLPTISLIGSQTINEDTLTNISFTVRDAETAAGSLTLVATSTNQQLLPDTSIFLGGSGSNRSVTLTPAPNRFGTTAIKLTVTDGAFGSSNLTFNLTVNPVNDAPTLSAIPNQSVSAGLSSGLVPFNVSDVETRAGDLLVTAASSNPALVPNGNIILGGSGTNRALVITPAAGQTGAATITVTVNDGQPQNGTASVNFTINVAAPPALLIEHRGNNAMVSWPADGASNWTLQSSPNFTTPDGWSVVAITPVFLNGRFTVTNSVSGETRYYRLKNP